MSALKIWAVSILAWGAMATAADAAPVSSLWDWTAWGSGSGVKEGVFNSTADSGPAAGSPAQPSSAPVAIPSAAPNPPVTHPDAYLDFGTSPYPEQSAADRRNGPAVVRQHLGRQGVWPYPRCPGANELHQQRCQRCAANIHRERVDGSERGLLDNRNVGRNGSTSSVVGGELLDGDQEILATVAEPATMALWGLVAMGGLVRSQTRWGLRRRAG